MAPVYFEVLWQSYHVLVLLVTHLHILFLKGEKVQLVETVDLLRGELNKEKITVQELTTTLNSERHQQQLIEVYHILSNLSYADLWFIKFLTYLNWLWM